MSGATVDLALKALAEGRLIEATALARQAAEAEPASGLAQRTLGLALQSSGELSAAFEAYGKALEIDPEDDGVAAALTNIAARSGMTDTALQLATHVVSRRPGDLDALMVMGDALLALNRSQEALELARLVSDHDPRFAAAHALSGRVLRHEGRLDEARAALNRALELDPANARMLYDLAWSEADEDLLDWAEQHVRLSLAHATDGETEARAGFLLSTILLARGDIPEGWAAYGTRHDPRLPGAPRYDVSLPRWDGEASLLGRSVLLVAEQGLGDEVAFLGMIPDLLNLVGPNGGIFISADKRLRPMIERSWPQIGFVESLTQTQELTRTRSITPPADAQLWLPIGDLLPVLRPDLSSFEAAEPGYLKVDPLKLAHWKAWLDTLPDGRRVGLTWRSGKMSEGRSRNFAPLPAWKPVLAKAGQVWINLQYGDVSAELAEFQRLAGVQIYTAPDLDLFGDLDGLAALAASLDLVIGFSNASTNIAGAVGAPLWLATPPAPWTALGSQSYPWYPSARRFTACQFDDWGPVMAELAEALKA